MKRQRPSRHIRRIKTRRGKKRIVINPHIKKRNYGMAWDIDLAEKEGKTTRINVFCVKFSEWVEPCRITSANSFG